MSKNSYKISDNVWIRVVQVVQEAMLMGCDVVDLLRQIRVDIVENTDTLELTSEYEHQVEDMHAKWLENAEKMQKEQEDKTVANSLNNTNLFN